MTSPPQPRPACWQGYARLHRWVVALLLGGLPGAVLVAIAVRRVFGTDSPLFLVAGAFIWSGVWAGSALRLVRWPCPRCGRPWLAAQDFRLGAPRRCAHCGLGLYEEPGPSAKADRR